MKIKSLLALALLGLIGARSAPSISVVAPLTGDYVEARTASVFAGPCHYNGELVTEGKQAIMAWHITAGYWKSVNLAGVSAMASVSCDDNLSVETAGRTWELVIDSKATQAQATAMAELIQTRIGAKPTITSHARILFEHDVDGYAVTANGFADLIVHPMPNDRCCTEPHLVWYNPLSPIEHRKVGYTESANYIAATNGEQWQRSDENSALYGSFQINGLK